MPALIVQPKKDAKGKEKGKDKDKGKAMRMPGDKKKSSKAGKKKVAIQDECVVEQGEGQGKAAECHVLRPETPYADVGGAAQDEADHHCLSLREAETRRVRRALINTATVRDKQLPSVFATS